MMHKYLQRIPRRDAVGYAAAVGLSGIVGFLARHRESPRPRTPIRTGTETVFILIASSTCAGVNDPRLPSAVNAVRSHLAAQSRQRGEELATLGVALDWHLNDGVRLLERFGGFDEVSIGRGWMNIAAVRFLWRDFPGVASIPQIIVLERDIVNEETIQILDERVRMRRVGAQQLIAWAETIESRDALS